MSVLMEVLERSEALAERLNTELIRVASGLEEMDRLRSQLPLGLGNSLPRVSLSDPGRLRTGGANLRTAAPTWAPACGALLTLQEAAVQWRDIADNMGTPITDSLDAARMSKDRRGWVSKGADEYDTFVLRDAAVSDGLEKLLRQGATAIKSAGDEIDNWMTGALVNFLALGGALLGLLGGLMGLIVTAKAFLAAWCVANETILSMSPWLLASAAAELSAALTPVLIALVGALGALIGVVVAAVGVQTYLQGVAEGAAQLINKVAGDLADSTKWRAPASLPGVSTW